MRSLSPNLLTRVLGAASALVLTRVLGAASALVLSLAPAAMAAKGDCAQPVSSGSGPNATDCTYLLRAAVGISSCDLCICDVNDNGSTTTIDALTCLKRAVGQSVSLGCPPCEGVTTTTEQSGPDESTTSTSTTSTTTTIPVRCSSESDCSALPQEFRCNPNTETCEKPCERNADCKDFYVCNKTTQYCEEPTLLF